MSTQINLNKMTRAELIALLSSDAVKVAKPKREKKAYRITNADKSCVVGTPLRGLDDAHAKGKTFAVWLDSSSGEAVKRRAYDGGDWLLVDTREIAKADVLEIANTWAKGKKLKSEVVTGGAGGVDGRPAVAVPCVLFTKAGK